MAYNYGKERKNTTILKNKKSYQEFLFQYNSYINFIDFLDKNKINYGFKNLNNLEILPKPSKSLFDDEYEIVALDFVVYAFKQLAQKYYSYLRDKQIASNSIINSILSQPKISQIGLNFEPILKNNTKEFNKIVYFDHEVGIKIKNVYEYADTYTSNLKKLKRPIQTHMKYINSKRVKNFNGLTITLLKNDLNNDQKKVDFMSDLNFPVLRKLAEQYGFYIDKNAPWQLVANLEHKNIKSIISKLYPNQKEITVDFILNEYFDVIMFLDYERQKQFFYDSYAALIENNIDFSSAYYCAKKQKTNLEIVSRSPLPTLEDYSKKEELFFLNNYLKLLNVEYEYKFNSVELINIFLNVSKIYSESLDKKKTLLYIYSNFEKLSL